MFARFDENPALTLQDIKKTKRYGRTDGRTHARTHTRTHTHTDNVKTVYPTTNKVCGGSTRALKEPMTATLGQNKVVGIVDKC